MNQFKQYTAYYLNHDVVTNLKLKPNTRQEIAVNKEEMLFVELLEKINDSGNNFTFEDMGFGTFNVRIDSNLYSFWFPPHSEIINSILQGRKNDEGYWIFDCMFLYVENSYILDDAPHSFNYFFLCKGDAIVEDRFCFSEYAGDLPKDILIERQENFTSNSLEDTSAYIKLMYNKWFKETLHGRVYAMKIKMKQRIELAQESGIVIPVDDSVENIYISIFREISSVQKSLKTIKVLFFVLIAIEIYFTVLK